MVGGAWKKHLFTFSCQTYTFVSAYWSSMRDLHCAAIGCHPGGKTLPMQAPRVAGSTHAIAPRADLNGALVDLQKSRPARRSMEPDRHVHACTPMHVWRPSGVCTNESWHTDAYAYGEPRQIPRAPYILAVAMIAQGIVRNGAAMRIFLARWNPYSIPMPYV